MKKLLLIFLVIICTNNYISAYSFSAVCSTGQTLYYNILSSTNKTVEVTNQTGYNGSGTSGSTYTIYPNGNLSIPNSVANYSVTSIGAYAFNGCNGLTSITIPTSITSIGNYAFNGCSGLDTLNLNAKNCSSPSSGLAFYGSNSVKTINIGDSVTTIPPSFFINFTRLQEINSKALIPPSLDETTFSGVSKNIPVYPPVASRAAYVFDPYWSEFLRVYAKDFTNNTVYLNKQIVSIMTVGSGFVLSEPVASGESVSYLIQPDTNFKISTLTVNGKNMLDSLDSNGYLNLKSLNENKAIVITPTNISGLSNITKSDDNTIRSWSADGNLFIESNQEMEQAELIDLNGRILIQKQDKAYTYVLNQPNQDINIVRVRLINGDIKTVKIKLN